MMDGGSSWHTLMRDTQRTGYTAEILKPPLDLAWRYERGGYFYASPTIVGGTVYLGGKRIYALDLADGTLVWRSDRIEVSGQGCTFWNGMLFACGVNAMFAIDTHTREIKFSVPMEGSAASTPCIHDRMVLWLSIKGRLFAADVESGAIRWTYDANSTRTSHRPQLMAL